MQIKFKAWDGKKMYDSTDSIIKLGLDGNCINVQTGKKLKLLQFTGSKLKGRELYTKDVIQFRYRDGCEPGGYGCCAGVIEFENGAFVVKEIGFKYYDWKNEDKRPTLLYDWVKFNRCKYIGNICEDPDILNKKS